LLIVSEVKKSAGLEQKIGSIMRKYYSHYIVTIAAISVLSLAIPNAHATKYQTPLSMKQAVKNFLMDDAKITHFTISKIDKRLRLRSCTNKLETSFPQYAEQIGRTTVQLSCNNPKPWKILVTVYIKKYLNILTAKHSLPAGTVIQASDIKMKRQEISNVRGGYFTDLAQITNMVVHRPLKPGRILSSAMLKPKRLVNQGDEILILAETGNLSIRVKGKALMNGFLGQRIKVKNVNSRRIFQATVISNGLVKVNM